MSHEVQVMVCIMGRGVCIMGHGVCVMSHKMHVIVWARDEVGCVPRCAAVHEPAITTMQATGPQQTVRWRDSEHGSMFKSARGFWGSTGEPCAACSSAQRPATQLVR